MPAYSFKEQFVPYVEEGSKPHTIRARRKNFAKKGDILYLYYGMRTRFCKKLREEICTDVRTIFIGMLLGKPEVGLFKDRLDDFQLQAMMDGKLDLQAHGFRILSAREKDQLAWSDGFRPKHTTFWNCEGCFDLMMKFWIGTHELPFYGDIIYWNPKKKIEYDYNKRNDLETTYY